MLAPSARLMTKRHKFLISAISIVIVISLFSATLDFVYGDSLKADVLALPIQIEVQTEQIDPRLTYGTESEVYRFSIEAGGFYTLRYVSFKFQHSGLDWTRFDSADEWKVYPVLSGQIDYLHQVGSGAEQSSGNLRVKMFQPGDKDSGYIGGAGKSGFALVTTVIDDKNTEPDFFAAYMPDEGWSWVVGAYGNSWGTLNEKSDTSAVKGLRTEMFTKSR